MASCAARCVSRWKVVGGDLAELREATIPQLDGIRDRLDAQADRIRALGFDERFLRSWRYYLGICSAAFAVGNTDVVQVELAHA